MTRSSWTSRAGDREFHPQVTRHVGEFSVRKCGIFRTASKLDVESQWTPGVEPLLSGFRACDFDMAS